MKFALSTDVFYLCTDGEFHEQKSQTEPPDDVKLFDTRAEALKKVESLGADYGIVEIIP